MTECECDKLHKVHKDSQKIGEFIDWLKEQGIHLCMEEIITEFDPDPEREKRFVPFQRNIDQLLASYFNIDLKKVEEEKRALLERMRNK